MKCTSTVLSPKQRLACVRKEAHNTKGVVYICVDRNNEWAILCQSLPKLAKWINENLSNGEVWDRVSVTGLFESMNRTDSRNGGWHKGRFRVQSIPLDRSEEIFESVRQQCSKAAVVAASLQKYDCR